jgi:hypothetical protein
MRIRIRQAGPRLALRNLFIGLTFAGAVSSPAEASNSKYFNGAFCRASFPLGGTSPQRYLKYNGNGSVANRDLTNSIEVVCPVVRDNTTNVGGWDSMEIGYFDKSGPDSIACTAWTGDPDGSLSFSQPGFSVNTMGTTWSKEGMTFGNNAGSFANGFHLIRCVLPTAPNTSDLSGIAYYRIQEP